MNEQMLFLLPVGVALLASGNTVISLSGSEVLRVEGVTGLKIGFSHNFSTEEQTDEVWTDVNGNSVDVDTLDVRIDLIGSRPVS